MPEYGRVAIVGVGLIGGSVAAALRARGLAGSIAGFSPDARQAQSLGLIDTAADTLAAALQGADLAVLAAPVPAIVQLVPELAGALPRGCLLTDVGSTKASIAAAAQAHLGEALGRFVPAHPIAGSERSGPAAADARLFEGARIIVSPLPQTAPEALARVSAFWAAMGGQVVEMPVEAHDALLAATSHLPHVAAFALALALARRDDADAARRMAGGGLRDTSRIAASSSALWADILLDNRAHLAQAMGQFEQGWQAIAQAIREGDRTRLAMLLDEAAHWRRTLA